MKRRKGKKTTSDFIKEHSRSLDKYQADIKVIENKLQELENILHKYTTQDLQRAISGKSKTLTYEDIHLLEIEVQDNMKKKFPIFHPIPILEGKLREIRRFALAETKKLNTAETLFAKEKSFGLYKLDDLCQNYQAYLLKKLRVIPETPIEKALKIALEDPALKNKAKNYYDKFIALNELRDLLSVDPEHQFNNQLSPEKRRFEFENALKQKAELFSTRSDKPLLFKDSEAGIKFLKEVEAVVSLTPVENKIPRKTR